MLVTAVIAAILAAFSPFLGLIFLIGVGGRYIVKDFRQIYVILAVYSLAAGLIGYLLSGGEPVAMVSILDSVIGVGVGVYILLYVLIHHKRFEYAILFFALYSLLYAGFRQFFLMEIILTSIKSSIEIVQGYAINSGLKEDDIESLIQSIVYTYTNYSIAIWVISALTGAYLGAVALSKSKLIFWNHKAIRMPYSLVYALVAVLVTFIILRNKTVSLNGLLIVAPLYLIQGVAVLDFFWGKFLARTVILRFFLMIALMLNPYMMIMVTFTGLFDVWFNFRKIYTKEDLDENHLS